MDQGRFKDYLTEFEEKVIVQGVEKNILGRPEMVAVRNGKLSKTPYGRLVGGVISTDVLMAIDYYGLTKKSLGFSAIVRDIDGQVRILESQVVHFASIRIENVAELATELVAEFPAFKHKLLKERGFKK